MKRLFVAGALLGALASPVASVAQDFPNRPVKIIVPFSTGTAADIVARQLGSRLADVWGQGVPIENQPGAAGNIGAAAVAKAPGDGYTLLMMGINNVINPALYREIQYDVPRDFKPVVRVAVAPLAIVANPKFAPNTIQELVALAKAKPGEVLFGSGGSGSITHLSIELLKMLAGVQMTHVPYKSIAPMLTDILGNQVPIGSPAAASVVSHAKAGTLKVLAITSARRSSAFPSVPTVAEAGFAGYDVAAWNGLVAPARTPDAIVDKIHADVAKIAQTREFADILQKQAMDVDLLDPPAFRAYIANELDKWAKVVKASGAKVD